MTPAAIRTARAQLGDLWGLGRPLRAAELGRALRLTGANPGQTVLNWEAGRREISGPATVAIEMMLAGGRLDGRSVDPAQPWKDALRELWEARNERGVGKTLISERIDRAWVVAEELVGRGR